MKKIAIYGASGHGKVVAEIAKLNGYSTIIYIDDGQNEFRSFDYFLEQDLSIPIALGIGDNKIREKVYQKCIDNHLEVATLIHPNAIVSSTMVVAEGTVIMAGVIVNSDAVIGKCCILNTSCVIEHDSIIGDYVHVSPQVACAGDIVIGDYSHIGIGSCIIQGIDIGSDTIVGAGSVVVKNIGNNKLAYGNPCRIMGDIQ